MLACDLSECWAQFLECAKKKSTTAAFENWLAPINLIEATEEEVVVEVPNLFVQDYVMTHYQEDLCAFLPVKSDGTPSIRFVVSKAQKPATEKKVPQPTSTTTQLISHKIRLNDHYRFETFIEGPSNQFVKSAAMGVADSPGKTYNLLFVHGGVGLGKTHLLHGIGHYVHQHHKKLRVHCVTTEGLINDLVDGLKKKSIDKVKHFYRQEVDVLLVDDIQFLEDRINFEEEFCNMFESLFNAGKQVVITSDKPPGQLHLSERMIARMEWGLVAHMGMPDLETRVAILQHKAELKGLHIPSQVAFYIAEHIHQNVRQLEGALNRLSAHSRLMNVPVTEELVEKALCELIQWTPKHRVTVDDILKSVAAVFQVKMNDIRGKVRTKGVAVPRQVAMFLAKELVKDSLKVIGAYFGKTHSTILHACKSVEQKMAEDETLRRQIDMVRRSIS